CIEEMLRQRYQGVKNEKGVWITPAFPKLIYVLEEDNIHPDDPYFYLTKLAAKCTAKRMVPDYISEKKMREYKLSKGETEGHGDVYTCMGCRSFLTPDRTGNGYDNVAKAKNYEPGKPKYYGRFNQGVVTINLPDVALSSNGNMDEFWKIFDERLELCHKALRCRHERLLGTTSDAAPILWQYGALARLDKGEKIDKLLYGGYSTISLGYAGLYECTKFMTGHSHTDKEATPFALAVMQHMNDKCSEWKAAENIDYSLYGTPLESTTYKFAKCLQRRFGIIPGITDKNYITNSYHVHVTEKIDAFTKLKFESEFQRLSPGGAISYVEVPNMQDNLEAVVRVMQFIYENIMYAELNTKSDYCQVCGYDGEIKIVEDDGKLVWECPKCGNRDQNKLNVARRTCGYIGTQFWNQGRTQEIKDRVLHL
ncbi:MAG: anaerobic ribonucleoside-triphosphate reductase, partial [Atopobiaceae bacterium]